MSLTAGPGTEVGTEQVLSVLGKKNNFLLKACQICPYLVVLQYML